MKIYFDASHNYQNDDIDDEPIDIDRTSTDRLYWEGRGREYTEDEKHVKTVETTDENSWSLCIINKNQNIACHEEYYNWLRIVREGIFKREGVDETSKFLLKVCFSIIIINIEIVCIIFGIGILVILFKLFMILISVLDWANNKKNGFPIEQWSPW